MLELKPEGMHLADAASQALAVCGRQLIADNSGALYWPSQSTLLAADLFPETSCSGSIAADGGAVPPPSAIRPTLARLADAIDRYEPARVVVLGGAAPAARSRMTADELEILGILQEGRDWVWVTGAPSADSTPRGGSICAELEISGIALRHRPTPGWATHEIAGHVRPAAHFSLYGYTLRRPCFVGNGRRLVMPAFGTVAGGLNVLDDAFRPLFPDGGMAVWMLGSEALYPVATRLLTVD